METLLIVVDMQKDFVDGALGTNEAVSIVPNVVKKITSHSGAIYVTLDTHSEEYLTTEEGKHLPVEHCIKGTDGWRLDASVQNSLNGKSYETIEKPTFGSVRLAERLKEQYGESLPPTELIGLCTDICVVSNALLLKATFPEASISVDSSCCAGVTPDTHKAALQTMRMCQIEIKE